MIFKLNSQTNTCTYLPSVLLSKPSPSNSWTCIDSSVILIMTIPYCSTPLPCPEPVIGLKTPPVAYCLDHYFFLIREPGQLFFYVDTSCCVTYYCLHAGQIRTCFLKRTCRIFLYSLPSSDFISINLNLNNQSHF